MVDAKRPVKSMGLLQDQEKQSTIATLPPVDGLRGIERLREEQDYTPEHATTYQPGHVQRLPIDRLTEYEYNPRSVYREEAILAMSQSISANGIINPIHVTPDPARDGWYKVIAGRTRVRAIQQYLKHREEFQTVPAIVHRTLSEKELAILAYTENQTRSTQYHVDVGLYCHKLLDDGVFKSQKELAGEMSDTESNISRLLSFGKLKDSIISIIFEHPEKFSHLTASQLLQVQNQYSEDAARKLAELVVEFGWSQRQLAKAINKLKAQDSTTETTYETINLLSTKQMAASVKTESTGRMELRLSGLADPSHRDEALSILRNAVEDIRRLIYKQAVADDGGS